jgi:hypothetical protein
MIDTALHFAIQNLLMVVAMYFTGSVFLRYFRIVPSNKFSQQYLSLLSGYVLVTLTIALLLTKGATSLVALLPIVVYLQLTRNKRSDERAAISRSEQIQFFSVLSAFVVILTFSFIYKYSGFLPNGEFVPEFHNDYVFYANVTSHITNIGYENNQIHIQGAFINLYHYSEMWLTSLSHFCFNVPYMRNYFWGAMPIIFTLFWYGFLGLSGMILKGRSTFTLAVVSSICFFVAPFAVLVNPFASILKGDVYELSFLDFNKFSILLLFLVALAHCGRKLESAIILLCTLTVVYPTTLPAVIGTSGILLIYHFIFEKEQRKKHIQLAILGVSVIGALGLLTLIFSNTGEVSKNVVATSFADRYIGSISEYVKTIINIFGSTALKIFISCLPYIALGIFLYRKIDKGILKLIYCGFLILHLAGLFAWALLFRMPDAVQLWNNIYVPTIAVILFILVMYALNDDRLPIKLLGYVIILGNLFTHSPFHSNYHQASASEKAIIEKTSAVSQPNFVFLRDSLEYGTKFDKYVNCAIIGNYLSFYNKTYAPVCLNFHQIKIDNDWEKGFVNGSGFAVFCEGKNKPMEELQKDYLNEKNVSFLVASRKATIPDFILANNPTVIEDSLNNIRLVPLKK